MKSILSIWERAGLGRGAGDGLGMTGDGWGRLGTAGDDWGQLAGDDWGQLGTLGMVV